MFDAERDIKKAKSGFGNDLIYKTTTGLKSDLSVQEKPEILNKIKSENQDDENNHESSSNSDSDSGKQN